MRKATARWALWLAQRVPRGVEEPVHAETFDDRNLGDPGVRLSSVGTRGRKAKA